MTKAESQHDDTRAARSFRPSDFSGRDVSGFLLTYILLSLICVVLGLAVDALSPFGKGCALGIAIGMTIPVGCSLIFTKGDRH